MVINAPEIEIKHKFNFTPRLLFEHDDEQKLIYLAAQKNIDEFPNDSKYSLESIQTNILPFVTVRYINEKSGYGLFTLRSFKKGEYIGEYSGMITKNREYLRLNNYLHLYPFKTTDGRHYSIDAEKHGNHTRFINHSFKPNLDKKFVVFDGMFHLIFILNQDIPANTQLSFDYGKNYWHLRGPPEIY